MRAELERSHWPLHWEVLEQLRKELFRYNTKYQLKAYQTVLGGVGLNEPVFQLINWTNGREVVCEHNYEDMCNVLRILISTEKEKMEERVAHSKQTNYWWLQ